MISDKNFTCMKDGRWPLHPTVQLAVPENTVQVTKTTSAGTTIRSTVKPIDEETA